MSSRIAKTLLLLIIAGTTNQARSEKKEQTAREVFDARILPIFRSPKPSSCIQCHLSSVDLKNYILPSADKTFVSLRDQGLIDVKNPSKSKILTLIRMGEKDLDKGARLIHTKNRRAELAAFEAWIAASVRDPRLMALPKLSASEYAKPDKPTAVIRHARKSRLLDSFVRNIWSQRMRCFPCHTPFEINANNPRHRVAIKNMKKFKKNYPDLIPRLPIFKRSPAETLSYLIERSRQTPQGELPLLNLKNPRQSLLVLKPTSKVPPQNPDKTFTKPSAVIPVSHIGGLKMHRNDVSYKSFIAWLEDYAKVVQGRYVSVDQLPLDNWRPTRRILRLFDVPTDWKKGTVVQLFLHARTQDGKWGKDAIAFTQGVVTPRLKVNGPLFMLAKAKVSSKKNDSPPERQSRGEAAPRRRGVPLPKGPYLVKVYVDHSNRIGKDPTLLLSQTDFVGSTEINPRRWRIGFRQAKVVYARNLKK